MIFKSISSFYHGFKNWTDRPIRPLTGHSSGLVRPIRPKWYWIGVRPLEPTVQLVNRTNRRVLFELVGSIKINFSSHYCHSSPATPLWWKRKASPFCPSEPTLALETPSFHDPAGTPAPTPTRKGSIFCSLEHPHATPRNPRPHPAPKKPTSLLPNPPPRAAVDGGKLPHLVLLLPGEKPSS